MGSEWILGRLAAGVNWMRLAKDRDWGTSCCECGDEPSGS
jgi:hypothetical protein